LLLLNVFRRDVLCFTLSNRNDFYVRGRRYKNGEVTYIRMHSFLFWLIVEKLERRIVSLFGYCLLCLDK